MSSEELAIAREVFGTEIRGLNELSDALDASFVQAIDILHGIKGTGRVVVTGMGKSGHIARKIAATLASTGTPAQFLHPGEASHGDLGMITSSDAVMALSNSGETSELADIVAYSKLKKLPLIAITRRADSTLAEAADAALIIPESAEACPLNLAPTTSTTAMLALGDAIAVVLLKRVGFTSNDFGVFHPGGRLGANLLKVSDIMHAGDAMPSISENASMADALIEMTAKSFGCVGIYGAAGELVGIITDGDLRRHMGNDLIGRNVIDIMSGAPRTVPPSFLVAEALRIMNDRKITGLFVEAAGKPVGIVHIHDCLRAGL